MSSRPFVLQNINIKSNVYVLSACRCGVGIMEVEFIRGRIYPQ